MAMIGMIGSEEPRRGRRRRRTRGEGHSSKQSTMIALGTLLAQDLRDEDGVARPVLRWAALRLALGPRRSACRLGDAYLRVDPAASPPERADANVRGARSSSPPTPSAAKEGPELLPRTAAALSSGAGPRYTAPEEEGLCQQEGASTNAQTTD
jgi:hypothetical protein